MKKILLMVLIAGSFTAFSQESKKETKKMEVIVKKSDDGKKVINENREVMVIMDDKHAGKIIEKRIINGDTVSVDVREIPAGEIHGVFPGEENSRVMILKDFDEEGFRDFDWNEKNGDHLMIKRMGKMKHFPDLKIRKGMPFNPDEMGSKTINGLKIHPNSPFDGKLNIKFSTEQKGNVTIAVMDINGKEIVKSEIKDFEGKYFGQISVKESDKGVFFVRVVQNGDGQVRRIQIN